MSYERFYPNGWQSGEAGGTPITPEAMNHIEEGILNAYQAMRNAAPRNLLDNGDFRNPVNQRGKDVYAYAGIYMYTIDRWAIYSEGAVVTVEDGYISKTKTLGQIIAGLDKNKTYTAAVCSKEGTVSVYSGTITNGIGSYYDNVYCYSGEGDRTVFEIPTRGFTEVQWVALYEGVYTAENLPEYKPKGYAAELAECQRYYLPDGGDAWSTMHTTSGYALWSIKLPVTMRITPSRIENATTKFAVYNNGWKEIDLSLFTIVSLHPGEITFVVSMSDIANLQLEVGKSYLIRGIPALSADL